jgi:hypothetical protein
MCLVALSTTTRRVLWGVCVVSCFVSTVSPLSLSLRIMGPPLSSCIGEHHNNNQGRWNVARKRTRLTFTVLAPTHTS